MKLSVRVIENTLNIKTQVQIFLNLVSRIEEKKMT